MTDAEQIAHVVAALEPSVAPFDDIAAMEYPALTFVLLGADRQVLRAMGYLRSGWVRWPGGDRPLADRHAIETWLASRGWTP